jgi:hypothetical protein
MKFLKKIFRFIIKVIKWAFLILLVLALFSTLYNFTLPKGSKTIEHLSANQKSHISETINLHQKIGNELWPGWSNIQIPVMVYNEKYSFLIGYPNPPSGWFKMPTQEFRGGKWEVVTNDDFYGLPYYRQSLPDAKITPENFTVKVGERWVATMQTEEYAAVKFYHEFREELPPVLDVIIPYKILWNILMANDEIYIVAIAHEMFHAFQGSQAPQRLAESEVVAYLDNEYPWHQNENVIGWIEETDMLLEAYYSEDKETSIQFVKKFIEERSLRRKMANLSSANIQYEQKREWLEGLAKYAELKIGLMASKNQLYNHIIEIEESPDFKDYKKFPTYFKQQIEEVRRAANRSGENRFYYTGMLQALILDSLAPGWKTEAFNEDVYLENLLEKAVIN